MGGIWAAIPLKWKVGILVGGFGLLLLTATIAGSIAYMYAQSKDHARLECKAAVQDETIKSLEAAQRDILNGILDLQTKEDEISNTRPEDDDTMGRGLVDTLNGL